jgi:hypothetical protein
MASALAGVALAFGGLAAVPARGFWLLGTSVCVYLAVLAFVEWSRGDSRAHPTALVVASALSVLALALPLAIAPRLPLLAIAAVLALGVYVASITYLCGVRSDDAAAERARRTATVVAWLSGAVALSLSATPSPFFAGVFMFALLVRGIPLFAPLRSTADAATIEEAVRGGILMVPLVDAMFVAAAARPLSALVVAAMMLPPLAAQRLERPG